MKCLVCTFGIFCITTPKIRSEIANFVSPAVDSNKWIMLIKYPQTDDDDLYYWKTFTNPFTTFSWVAIISTSLVNGLIIQLISREVLHQFTFFLILF